MGDIMKLDDICDKVACHLLKGEMVEVMVKSHVFPFRVGHVMKALNFSKDHDLLLEGFGDYGLKPTRFRKASI